MTANKKEDVLRSRIAELEAENKRLTTWTPFTANSMPPAVSGYYPVLYKQHRIDKIAVKTCGMFWWDAEKKAWDEPYDCIGFLVTDFKPVVCLEPPVRCVSCKEPLEPPYGSTIHIGDEKFAMCIKCTQELYEED